MRHIVMEHPATQSRCFTVTDRITKVAGGKALYLSDFYMTLSNYNIPAPQLIFFKGLFWGAYFWSDLYSDRLMYGGKFAFQNQLGLPYSWKEIYRFCFVLCCIWGQFPIQFYNHYGTLITGCLIKGSEGSTVLSIFSI